MSIRQTDDILFVEEPKHTARFSLAAITKNPARCTTCTVVCVCVCVVLTVFAIIAIAITACT